MVNWKPHYRRYLKWWMLVWVLITPWTFAITPRNLVLHSWHDVLGMIVYFSIMALVEALFGLLWGTVSWQLQGSNVREMLRQQRRRKERGRPFRTIISSWPALPAAALVAAFDAIVFGLPLAWVQSVLDAFGNFMSDDPSPPDSDLTVQFRAVALVFAFILASLLAGYLTGPSEDDLAESKTEKPR